MATATAEKSSDKASESKTTRRASKSADIDMNETYQSDYEVDPKVSDNTNAWNAAQAFAAPVVAAWATERQRTWDLMVSGAPMYGAPAAP